MDTGRRTSRIATQQKIRKQKYSSQEYRLTQIVQKLVEDYVLDEAGHTNLKEWLAIKVCRILDADACSIVIFENDQIEVFLKTPHEEEQAWLYHIPQESNLTRILNECIQSGTPFVITQLDKKVHDLFAANPKFRPKSVLGAPLSVEGKQLGVLGAWNKKNGSFSDYDRFLLSLIAKTFSPIINNIHRLQKLKVTNAELGVKFYQLRKSRNTLRTLFDNLPTSIYIIDTQFVLTAINLHRSNRVGCHPNMLVGQRCYEVLAQREDICPDCRVLDTLYNAQTTKRTHRDWQLDREAQEWEIVSFPIFDEENKVVQAILMEEDVTEKRRLEATLAQSEKLAAVGQLAAGIAHEINNPLTAIVANAQLLQRELPADDDRQELVELISSAGDRAAQVVRNLLDLARKEQYNFIPTDVNETIRKAVALLQHEFVAHSVKLEVELAPGLPKIMASESHLQGVWINLLTNAMDASENSHCELRIASSQQGNKLRVLVADNGNGIPPERLSWIFEPFYTTKAPGRGTGLGLSVCHRIIKQHEGNIFVDSQVNQGTMFTVTLPIS